MVSMMIILINGPIDGTNNIQMYKNEIETDLDYIFCLTSKPNGFFLTVITFTERKLLHNVKMREMALHILMGVGVNFLECAFMIATCCRDARERDFVS